VQRGVLPDVALVIDEEDGVGDGVAGLEAGGDVEGGPFFGAFLVLEGEDDQVPYRFIDVAFFQVLRDDGDARSPSRRRAGDEQEGVRLEEFLGGPDGVDDFIGVFLGDFGAQLVDLADAVAAGLAAADEDAVTMVVADAAQAAQVGGIRVDREAPVTIVMPRRLWALELSRANSSAILPRIDPDRQLLISSFTSMVIKLTLQLFLT
jgi:hypothetical protein